MIHKGINRVDANQGQIVQAFERAGAVVIDVTGDSSIGFDLLVAWRGFLIPIEVKDGSKKPADRKLTDKEKTRLAQLAAVGVNIHVVQSPADVGRLLGVSVETGDDNGRAI